MLPPLKIGGMLLNWDDRNGSWNYKGPMGIKARIEYDGNHWWGSFQIGQVTISTSRVETLTAATNALRLLALDIAKLAKAVE